MILKFYKKLSFFPIFFRGVLNLLSQVLSQERQILCLVKSEFVANSLKFTLDEVIFNIFNLVPSFSDVF